MNKKTLTTAKQRLIRSRWWVLVILLVTGLIGFGVYRDYSIKADKEKFEQAKASIDALYTDIVARAGEPEKVEIKESCSRASRKLEKGPLSCGSHVYLVYPTANESEATALVININDTLNLASDTLKITYTNSSTELPFEEVNASVKRQETSSSFIDIRSGISCSMSFVYALSGDLYHVFSSDVSEKSTSVQIVCGDSAKAEYYPLINH